MYREIKDNLIPETRLYFILLLKINEKSRVLFLFTGLLIYFFFFVERFSSIIKTNKINKPLNYLVLNELFPAAIISSSHISKD